MNSESLKKAFLFANKYKKLVFTSVFVLFAFGFFALTSIQANTAKAAVSFDVGTESHTATTASTSVASFSWSHTATASAEGALVFVWTNANADYITSVTYGGTAMTQVSEAADTAGEPGRMTAFFLGSSVPSGTQTVVVTRTNNATQMYAVAVTVQAATATTETTGAALVQTDCTLGEAAVDDGSPGANSIRFAATHSGVNTVTAQGASSTAVQSIDPGNAVAIVTRETTAGQGSRNVGFAAAASDDCATIRIAVREVPNITISGNIYDSTSDTGTTALPACDGSTGTMVALKVGSSAVTTANCADANGAYTFSVPRPAAGTAVSVWINGVASTFGTTSTVYDGSGDITGLNVRQNRLTVTADSGQSNTNTLLDNYDDSGDTDIVYTVTTGTLTVEDGIKTIVDGVWLAGGNVTTSPSNDGTNSVIDGDFACSGTGDYINHSNYTLSIGGDFAGASGNACIINASGHTVQFTATASGHEIDNTGGIPLTYVKNLTFNGVGGGWTLTGNLPIEQVLTITNGDFNAGTGNTITLAGTGTPFINNGTFTAGTSTVTYTNATSANVAGVNYYNLTLTPSSGTPTYTLTSGINWTQSYDAAGTQIEGIHYDPNTAAIYAGAFNSGEIYRCLTSTGCDAQGDWTVSIDTAESRINSFTTDTVNGVIYATGGGTGSIYRCPTSTSCDASGDWTVVYDPTDNTSQGLFYDSINAVVYAGSGGSGLIYRCATSTGCDASGEWVTVYDHSTDTFIMNFTHDTTNGVIYAGTILTTGNVLRCVTSSGCDAQGDWTVSYDATNGRITSLTFDSTNGVLYAGDGSLGEIFRCPVSSSCDAQGDWASVLDSPYAAVNDLEFDAANGIVFAAMGSTGETYVCYVTTGCDTGGEWSITTNGDTASSYALAHDTVNGVMYLGTASAGLIYRGAIANPVVQNNLTINANATLSAGSTTLTIGNDFTNSGTFTAGTSTVVFNNSAQTSDITGSNTFYNLRVNTPNKTVRFTQGTTTTIASGGNITVNGSAGNLVTFTSVSGAATWTINHNAAATESITYLAVNWGACHGSSSTITMGVGSTKDGNSGACWDPPIVITIGGTVYTDEGSTNIGANKTVSLKVNGVGTYTDETDAGGVYSITNVGVVSGATVTIYLEGETENASTVTLTGTSNLSNVDLYQNRLIARTEIGSPISTFNISIYDDGNDPGTGDVVFDVDAFNNLVVHDGIKLLVGTASTLLADGNITTSSSADSASVDGDVYVNLSGTLDMGPYNLYVGGDLGFGFGAGYSYSVTPAIVFTATTSGHTVDSNGNVFSSVDFTGGGGWTLGNLDLNYEFRITSGTVTAPSFLSTALFVNNGTFIHNSGLVTISGGGLSGTLSGANGKFYDLYIITSAPSVTSSLEVVNDLTMASSGGLSMDGASLTLGRNLYIDEITGGSFFSNNTVILNTSATSIITGTSVAGITFTNLTVATAGKIVRFADGVVVKITGLLSVTGSNGNNVIFNSESGTGTWTIDHQGTESITYLTVNWGACYVGSPSSTTITMGTGSTKDGNSGACWDAPANPITLSGTVYLSDAVTVDTSGQTLFASIGGGSSVSTTANGSGVFTFSNFGPPSIGNIITVWINGGSVFGTAVIKYGTSCTGNPNCTGINLVRNAVTIYGKNGTNVTNSDLAVCDADDGGFGCGTSDIGFNVDNSTSVLTVSNGLALDIKGSTTFAPGFAVVTSVSTDGTDSNRDGDVNIESGSDITMGTNSLTVGGDFGSLGTFTKSSGQTTTFTATATGHTIHNNYSNWENVVLNGAAGGWSFGSSHADVTIDSDLTVTAGTLSGTIPINVNGGDFSGNGSVNLTGGTVTITGTGNLGGSNGWTFNNLTLGSGASGTTTKSGSGNITIGGTTGVLTISTNHTLNAGSGGMNWLLAATSGTPMVRNGSFVPGNSGFYFGLNGGSVNLPAATMTGANAFYRIVANTGATVTAQAAVEATDFIGIFNTATLVMGANSLTLGNNTTGSSNSDIVLFTVGSGSLTQSASATTTILADNGGAACIGGSPTCSAGALTGSLSFGDLVVGNGSNTFTLTFANATLPITMDSLTVNTNATLTAAYNTSATGAVTGNGVINMTAGTFTHNATTSQNFGGDTAWTFNNLTLSGASGTTAATGTGAVTVNGALTAGASHVFNAGAKTWILNNNSTPFSIVGTFTPSTSTLSYRGLGNLDLPGGTYYNLDFAPVSGSNIYNFLGSPLVANNLTIGGAGNANVDIDDEVSSADINGSVTIGAGDTLTSTGINMNVGGSFTNSGTMSMGDTTVIFDSTSTGRTITSGGGSFNSISFNGSGGEWTLQDNLSVSSALTIANGNLNASSRTITLSSSGTPFVKSGGTFTQGTSTVVYDGNGNTNVLGLNGPSTTDAYYNLNIKTSNVMFPYTYTLSSGVTVNNAVTVGGGTCDGSATLALGLYTMTLKGSGTPLNFTNCGLLSADDGTVIYSSGSGTAALSNFDLTGNRDLNDLQINGAGTFNIGTNIDLDILSNLSIVSGATLSGGTNNIIVGANATGLGAINLTGGTFTMNGSGDFGSLSNWSFNNLTFSSTAAVTAVDAGGINVAGVMTIEGKDTNLDAGSKTWTLSGTGTPLVTNDNFNTATSTFNYTGAGATNIVPWVYHNLGVRPGANSVTHTLAAGNLTVGGTLTVGNGTNTGVEFTAATNNNVVDLNGTGTSISISANSTFRAPGSAALTVAGSWANAGTFLSSNGTVTFDAASTGKTIQSNGSSFGFVTFNGSGGGWSPSDAMIVAGDLTMTAGTLSGTQNVTVNGGDVTGNGDVNMSSGTFTIAGTGNLGGDTTWDFSNLTLSGAFNTTTATGTGGINIAGTLTNNASHAINAGFKTWTLSGTGTPINNSGGFTPSTSTLHYTGATVSIAAVDYNDLILGGTGTYTMPATAINIGGNLTITTGSTVTKGAGTITFTGSSATLTDNTALKQDLGAIVSDVVSGSGINVAAAANGGSVVSSSTINGSYPESAVIDGYRYAGGSAPSWGSGGGWNDNTNGSFPDSLTVTFGGTYSIDEINVFTIPDSLSTGTTPTLDDTFTQYGIVAFDVQYWNGSTWTTIQSVTGNNKVWRRFTFSPVSTNQIRLVVNDALGGYSRVLELEAWSIDGGGLALGSSAKATSVTINSGRGLSLNGSNTLTLTGNGTPLVNNGTFTASTGTVNFESTGTSGTSIPDIGQYYNLVVNRADNNFTLPEDLVVGNNLTISAGTLTAAAGASLFIINDFTNNGTFVHNNGDVVFSPATGDTVNIGGSSNTTFYSLTNTTPRTTMQFANGRTYAIDGTWTVAGTNGRPIWIQSSTPGQQWLVDVNGSAAISFANVKDSGCSSSANISTSNRVFNQGNNGACWLFIIFGGGSSNAPSGGGSGGSGGTTGGGSGGGNSSGTTATATVTVSGNVVVSFQITSGGTNYLTAPVISVCAVGAGSGATATTTISGGSVNAINVVSGGSEYTSGATATIASPSSPDAAPGCGGTSGGGQGGGGGGGSP